MIVAELPLIRTDAHLSVEKRRQVWLERILYNWSVWKRSGGMSNFHVEAGSVGEGYTHQDTEGAYIRSDIQMGQIADAVVRDLKLLERDAIHAEYLDCAWPHDMSVNRVLVIAHESVRLGLKRKGYEWGA